MNGKELYPSTLINYEIVRISRNGKQEIFKIVNSKNIKRADFVIGLLLAFISIAVIIKYLNKLRK